MLFLAFPAEKATSQKCCLLMGSWWPCCRSKHFFSNETILSCTFWILLVSGLNMAQKCPLMQSMEAGTQKMPIGNWPCSSLVFSFQTRFQNPPLWVSHPGRSGLYLIPSGDGVCVCVCVCVYVCMYVWFEEAGLVTDSNYVVTSFRKNRAP